MNVIVRKAQVCDIPELFKMNNIINEVNCTVEHMRISLEKHVNEIVLVAINDDKAIGFICGQIYPSICYSDGVQCEVTELFVKEEYRKQGVASKLIAKLEHEFELNSVQEILLQTGKKNTVAQKFYEKNGYINSERIVYQKKYYIAK